MSNLDYSNFLGIKSFTSEGAIDFKQGDATATTYVLTAAQRAYLNGQGLSVDKGIILPKQVHGDVIWKVTARDLAQAGIFEADALVSDVKGLPIAIRTADCLPALLYDPRRGVIAAVHAGWKSTRLDIARKTVELMRRDYQVNPADLRVAIGPCIRRESCEVGPEFKDYFPQETFETPRGRRFDVAAANLRQLIGAGVKCENIFDCGEDTFTDRVRFHSFRRDADAAGRLISVIMM